MIDRLVHHAEVASLHGDFYRLKDRDLGRPKNSANDDHDQPGVNFTWAVSTNGRNTSEILGVVLSSSRRVKKGPGRRPQSAKRQRFMELRERGWSILAAAAEVGVSRTTGNNWSRGYKTYRHGQVVGFVSALERLAVRQISPRFLSQEERIEIADLRHAGFKHPSDRASAGSGGLDGVAGVAPQRDQE
jgi:hypothetical protein